MTHMGHSGATMPDLAPIALYLLNNRALMFLKKDNICQ